MKQPNVTIILLHLFFGVLVFIGSTLFFWQADESMSGSRHSLISIKGVSENFTMKENLDTTLEDNQGIFTFEVEITALAKDVYIPNAATTKSSSVTEGFVTTITGDVYNVITTAFVGETSADAVGGSYKIARGTSETFKLVVELDPTRDAANYGIDLTKIMFSDSSDGDLVPYKVPVTDEFSIPVQLIEN
jgi:hypothetical protein